jgi:DNA-binding transcriptional ArsR family regulator
VASDTFYTFVGDGTPEASDDPIAHDQVRYPARIAVYDDPTITPRVVVIQPTNIRDYLEKITATTTQLSHEQGGTIPFMIIREIVENYIHAAFIAPTVSILDAGNTIRFSDQGPGIEDKEKALEYGTTSATEEMKRYIRGVGSGLPLAQQYMLDKGGSLTIRDNLSCGTVVTISTRSEDDASMPIAPMRHEKVQDDQAPAEPETSHADDALLELEVAERGRQALAYLADHDSVGPSDLVAVYKGSQPTWSRELKVLEEKGLLVKRGQKRHLTELGKAYIKLSR